jgi:quercetin dioxygenase-like cupin family protein
MDRETFLAELAQAGFDEILTVERAANVELGEHTHPFEARALVLSGEIRIRCRNGEQICRVGDTFHLQSGEQHSESYGPEGVRYLVGRK